jgi:3-oxoadipate enol-lactonase
MAICRLPGVDIAYRLEGLAERPVLALCNSLGTDFGMWDPQVPALTEHFRVLRYDNRGHGASSTPPAGFSIADMAHDLIGLTQHLGIEKFAFCGLSLGGLIGQHLGIQHGDRLTKLVLANTAPVLPPKEGWDARAKAVREGGMEAIVDLAMQRVFSDGYRARNEPIAATVRTTFLATEPEGYAGACIAVREADYSQELGRIGTPTLCIGGSLDISTPPAVTDAMTQAIPGARQVVLEAAHISNIEQPAPFNAAVVAFLTSS